MGILFIVNENFVRSRIEFLNILVAKSDAAQIGVIKNSIMIVRYTQVFEDHKSSLVVLEIDLAIELFVPLDQYF